MNKNGSKWIRRSTRLAIYLRDEFTCLYCSKYLGDMPKLLTLDHVLPRAKDGRYNDVRNLATCCKTCNMTKADRELSAIEYEKIEPLLRKELPRAKARAVLGKKEGLGISISWLIT